MINKRVSPGKFRVTHQIYVAQHLGAAQPQSDALSY
jgi:hypothetical protein